MIQNETPRQHDYVADGIQVAYPYAFLIFEASDLQVYVNGSLMSLNSHYTVSNVGVEAGGTVTFLTAPVDTAAVAIRSAVPAKQVTHFEDGSRFPAATVEALADRLVAIHQQGVDRLRRVPALAQFSPYEDLTLPDPEPGKILIWNAGGTGFDNTTNGEQGPQGVQGVQGVPGAGASPTVREVDGSPSVAVPTVLEFDQADGFAVTEPSAGVARVKLTVTGVPVGSMVEYGAAAAPAGWLLCNGAEISRSTFSALFAVIGTTWGAGNGTTTFNVPDRRGRVGVGAGTGAGLSARTLAATGGAETHQLTVAEMPAHAHTIAFTPQVVAATGGNQPLTAGGTTQTSSTGGGDAHPIMPPFINVTHIIKT